MATELEGEHSATTTTLTTAAAEDLSLRQGAIIAVESELMRFEGYGRVGGHRTNTKLVVTRAVRGTTAATHADATAVTLHDASRSAPAAAVANVSTADGSDAATTQALANALKTKVNALLAALRAEGIIAS